MTEVEQLNSKIGSEYRSIDGRALFRLVWSENIFENRYGTFREFSSGGLFIREVTEVRRVRKYGYIHNRWIFEAWAPGNITANPETPDAVNGDYAPVYVFEDRHGNYLPPNEKVIRFIIAAMQGKVKKDDVPSEEYLEEREIQRTTETLDDHPAWFQTRPGETRNAIWYSGGVPEWEHRRARFSESLERPSETRKNAVAKIFREELQDIADLEAEKERLRAEIKPDVTVESPTHRRPN